MENKKHDISGDKKLADSKMSDDRKKISPARTDEHLLTPGPSSHTPDGQSTKSS